MIINLFDITIETLSKKEILEKIKKCIFTRSKFTHIVSLNPENIIIAQKNEKFKKVLATAQIKIIDGAGIFLASRLLGRPLKHRISGVDLMREMFLLADQERLRVALIGGRSEVAERLINCQKSLYPQINFLADQAILDIKNPLTAEEARLFSIVADFKPHFVFVAFGSPDQELWLDCHRDQFAGMVVMGVGGAFDYLSGMVPRAPSFVRRIGLEWSFRFLVQPWRWRRQLRLWQFIYLTGRELVQRIKR